MKVLFISGSFPPIKCGIGDYAALLARELSRRSGVRIAVLTSSSAEAGSAGPDVEVYPVIPSWTMSNIARVIQYVRDVKPDIIHIQYPTKGYGRGKMPLLLPLLFRWMAIPVVQTWHEPLSRLRAVRYLPCALARDVLVTVERDFCTYIPRWLFRLLEKQKEIRHIPVGLSIPATSLTKEETDQVRQEYNVSGRLMTYFGFAAAAKGIEQLFELADPGRDSILLLCDLDPENGYHSRLLAIMNSAAWKGRAFATGYLGPMEIARYLAASDVAVFPFKTGMTDRNTSVLAARAQGTFVVTTSASLRGYNGQQHTWYAAPGNTEEMREAIRLHAGTRRAVADTGVPDWGSIADMHVALYHKVVAECGQRPC